MDKKFVIRILALTMVAVLIHAYLNKDFLFSEADELDLNMGTILELNSEKTDSDKESYPNEETNTVEETESAEDTAQGDEVDTKEDEKNDETKSDQDKKSSDDADGQERDDKKDGSKLRNAKSGTSDDDEPDDGENPDDEQNQEGQQNHEGDGTQTGEEKNSWAITVQDGIEHVSIEISNNNPSTGDTVALKATVDEGYQLKSVTVKPAQADTFSEFTLTPSEDGSCEFTQPEGDAIIDASAEIAIYTIAEPTTEQTECSIQIQGILRQPDSTAEGNTNACVGDKVILAITSKVGSILSSITVTADTGSTIDAVKNLDDNYEFIMPAANINSIVAVFTDFIILEEATKPFIVNANGNAVPQVGDRLTAVTYALPNIQWKWYADEVFIEGATEQNLILTGKELGKSIKVEAIQPRNAAGEGRPGNDISIMSEATPVVVEKVDGTITTEEAVASVVYDYINEIVTAAEGYEVSLSDSVLEGQPALVITEIIDRDINRVVYVRRKATESNPPSEWLAVFIPERPAAPVLSVENATESDWNNGGLVGTTVAMEYRLDSEVNYSRASDTYTKVKIGKYSVRYAASATAFAGKTTELTVGRAVIELSAQNRPVIVNISASRSQPIIGDVLEVRVNAGPGISYQWYAGGTAIRGATGTRYTLPASTFNKRIVVKATQQANVDGAGHPANAITISSAEVGPVKKVPADSLSEAEIKRQLSYNYPMEVVAVNSEYEISTGSGTAGSSSLKLTSVLDRNSAKYIYGRKKASDWQEASAWVRVNIPERPASPGNLTTESASSSTAADGKIIGTSTSMEYKPSGASVYTRASASFTSVKAGTYYVRVAATGSSFASKYVTVKVDSGKEKEETTTVTKKTTAKKTSSKKSNKTKKTEVDGVGSALDFDLIDKDNLWENLSSENKAALKELLEATSGELIDANNILDTSADQENTISVNDIPLALVVGKGVVVIELEKSDSDVFLPDAYGVVKGILNEEQIDLISRGGIVELKISADSIFEDGVSAEDKATFEKGFLEYSEEYPNLMKDGYVNISLSYKFSSNDWKEVTETLVPIKFVFNLSEDLKNLSHDFYMIRVHNGENTLLSDMDEDESTVTISSEQFSTYLLVSTPKVLPEVPEPTVTEDVSEESNKLGAIKFFVANQWPILFWALVGLDIVYIVVRKVRKVRRLRTIENK